MVFPVAAMVGGSIASGLLGSRGAKKAAKQQAAAFQGAIDQQRVSYNAAQDRLDPRLQQEGAAMERVNALLGLGGEAPDFSLFRDTPGYEFLLDEARRATERSAAARGGLVSGNTLVELQDRSQGLADTTFQNYLAQVMGLQNQGVDSTLAGMDLDFGARVGELMIGKGGARASGTVGSTNALTGMMSGLSTAGGRMFGANSIKARPTGIGSPPINRLPVPNFATAPGGLGLRRLP